MRSSGHSARNQPLRDDTSIEIPRRLARKAQELGELTDRVPFAPELQRVRAALIEQLLAKLRPGEAPSVRAALLNDLGNAYFFLPSGDRAANLTRAIACYEEAL